MNYGAAVYSWLFLYNSKKYRIVHAEYKRKVIVILLNKQSYKLKIIAETGFKACSTQAWA